VKFGLNFFDHLKFGKKKMAETGLMSFRPVEFLPFVVNPKIHYSAQFFQRKITWPSKIRPKETPPNQLRGGKIFMYKRHPCLHHYTDKETSTFVKMESV
jgi:hypothetical protein